MRARRAGVGLLLVALIGCGDAGSRGPYVGESERHGAMRLTLRKGHYDLVLERRSETHDTLRTETEASTSASVALQSVSYGGLTETRGDTTWLLGIPGRPYVLAKRSAATYVSEEETIQLRRE